MENKYFKCYNCNTLNTYYVHKIQKGKECKYCQIYNYFKQQKNKNSKKKNNNNHNIQNNSNNNLVIIQQSQIHYNGHPNRDNFNKNLKIIPQSQIQYNGIPNVNNNFAPSENNSSNINSSKSFSNFAQISLLNSSFNRINTNINNNLENYIVQLNNLIMNIPFNPSERYDYFGELLYDKIKSFPVYQNYAHYFLKIIGIFLDLDQITIVKLIINDRFFNVNVQDVINLLEENCRKIIGPKKEKLTQDIIINNKKDLFVQYV